MGDHGHGRGAQDVARRGGDGPPPAKRGRAALYHRVSTIDQDAHAAELELGRAARVRGLRVVIDERETGSGAANDRPGLLRVMDAARRGAIDVVLVWKLDRFGRSALDLLANLRELDACGVRFVAITQGLDLQPGGDPMSRLLLMVLAAVAEFERDLIRERTRLGIARARRAGKQIGRPRGDRPPIEKVRALRVAGRSWSEVAAALGCTVRIARLVMDEGAKKRPARKGVRFRRRRSDEE